MMYLGDFVSAAIVRAFFDTSTLGGAPATLGGTPLVRVYKNSDTTESSTGITLTVDYDSRTGLNLVEVDTSDAFYADASDFSIVLIQGTLSGSNIAPKVLAQFSIANRPLASGVDVTSIDGDAVAASNLQQSASVIYQGSVTGAATATTLVDSALTQSATDFWNGRIIIFTSGALKYQATNITGFTPGTDTLTFTALTAAPSGADTYVIV